MNNQKKALLVALAVAGVSISGPMVKWSLSCGASPVMIAFGRMAISFLLLLVPALRSGELQAILRAPKKQVALACAAGLLLEPIKREAVPGAVVAVVGAAAIGLLSMGGESGSLLGDALALIGAAFIAGHWLTSRAARRNLPALGFMTFVYGVTAVFLLLISPFAGGLAVTGESIYGIIVLAVVCTLGGHALMTYLLGFVSADVVSFALLAEPIGAAVWALLLFHEKVMPPLMIGGLTVIVGLMLYTYGEMKAGKR